MLLNCGVGEDSWESLGLQGDPTSPSWRSSVLGVLWKELKLKDAKAETPILWPPHAKSWLIRKDSDAGRDWGQEEKGTTEDEMAGWHHQLDGHEFEWTLGVGDGQGGLACCDSWGHKESDTTEWLNWTELKFCKGELLYIEANLESKEHWLNRIWEPLNSTVLIHEGWDKNRKYSSDFEGPIHYVTSEQQS